MPARPSAEIRVVEVQKLRTFYDFCWPRAALCGDSRGRGSKTEGFLRFLLAARDPLRRFAWSRFKNWGFLRFLRCARDPLRRSCASKRSRCGAVRICFSLGEPSAEIVRVEVLSLWRCAGLWKLSRGLRACFRNPAVAGSIPPWSAAAPAWKSQPLSINVVRGACSCSSDGSDWKIVTFRCKRSTRSTPPQLRLENRNVVRGPYSCSSGWKIATFKYRRSMRSVLPRNFKVQT